jgi:tetratricopeptide (TPR) repeat protein
VTDTKTISKRQLADDARTLAMDGRWEEAIAINRLIIERSARDASAYNRLGKAHLELGDVVQATEAYTGALKADPANMIARRNLQRLEQLRGHEAEILQREKRLTPRTNVFIQEVGKTWVDELINTASTDVLAEVASGEALELYVQKGRLFVKRSDGVQIGEIEQRTAVRVIELMNGGNQYEIYALGTSAAGLRIILRESYRDPSQADRVSFPRQISQAGKDLRARDLLRQRDEAEFYFSDDDDEETESETEEVVADTTDEDDNLAENGNDFVEETPEDEEESE